MLRMDKEALRRAFAREWRRHYDLDFFREMGFERRYCPEHDKYFWTLDPDRRVCGEPDHTGYTFIGNPAGRRHSYAEMWKRMADFYERHGHTVVPRYPVVARWRDDIYFTIASIAVFQPYVVRGDVEPPANPLLIPQPCLRFKDVENVGLSGRHMTSFVMVGQHAFNTKENTVLWKNEAVSLMFEFLTRKVGIKPEEITFHEDVWAGGGNYGPSIEYFVRGLELGNIVFMQYEESGRELETRVIDHGIGLSRFAWVTQGVYTAYDVVFPSVMDYLRSFYEPDIPRDVMGRFARLSGKINYGEGDVEKIMERIERDLKYPGFFKEFEPMKELYAMGDHTRTILFAATDGAFPSNVGGGYNLRVLARRMFSALDRYGWDVDFGKVFELHARDAEALFPELSEGVETAVAVMEEERRKYEQSKKRGYSKVLTIVKKKGRLDVDDYVLLYRSYGIPPETVAEIAKTEIPPGVYAKIAEYRERKPEKEKGEIPVNVSKYPETRKLYYEDPHLFVFTATVLGVEGDWVILDQTAFYPEGGGQEADRGTINGLPVVDVQKKQGVVLHLVKGAERLRPGEKVEGRVDARRRLRHMRHHTSAHIILAAARRVLGRHVWQAGAHKSESVAHIDLTHFRRISDEELKEIERVANEIIRENHDVRTYFMKRNEAEARFGITIYQGGAVPGKVLRIVEIPGIDVEACGGTHVTSTGEIGLLKIVKRESVADGVERIVYKAGDVALEHVQRLEETLRRAAEILRVPVDEVPAAAEKMFNMWKEAEKRAEKLMQRIAELEAERITEHVVVYDDLDQKMALAIGERASVRPLVIIVRRGRPNIFVFAENAPDILRRIVERAGGSGGGKRGRAVGVVENVDAAVDAAGDIVAELSSR